MKEMIHQDILPLEAFSLEFKAFCLEYGLSNRKLSSLLKHREFASKSSIGRLLNGEASEANYLGIIAPLQAALEGFLTQKGLDPSQISDVLIKLFPSYKEKDMIFDRCELPPDAIVFFGFNRDPFDVGTVPQNDEMFRDAPFDAIAARIANAIIGNQFIAVIGPVGSGKTALKARVARELYASRSHEVRLLSPEYFDMSDVKVGSIARHILEEFEAKCPMEGASRVRKIKHLLGSMHQSGIRTGLVFDEGHRLNDKVISSLKNFWELTNGAFDRLLSVILFGQPVLKSRLLDVKFREIAERIQIIEMPDLQKSARDYLAHKLRIAGGDIGALFEEKALEKIVSSAKTPLALGNRANSALLEAFQFKQQKVEASMIKSPSETIAYRKAS